MPEAVDLEQRLALLQVEIDWPATPALAGRVRARIAAPVIVRRPLGSPRRRLGRQWALAAAAVLVVLAALIAYTPSRDAIASWINLHTIFTRVNQLPTPSPLPSGPLGKRLGLGDPTTLDQAQSKVTWHIVVPASLGRPDEVYLQLPPDGPPQGEVTLVYKLRPGLKTSGQTGVAVLVTEASGSVDTQIFSKMLGTDTTLEEVTVNGHNGYWIAGQPHIFVFIDANGQFRSETMRLATNTLLIDDNGTVVRIEGDLTKAQALEMASSLS
ncbi:MAG TPA: hypothetical protein VF990_15865 [Candidatus Dormibacteraeota bacterium]